MASALHICVQFVSCTAGGSLLILAVAVDLIWTTLGTHGGGPLTGRAMRILWRGIIALRGRSEAHRLLSFVGSIMLALTVVVWMGLLWLGCFAIFMARGGAGGTSGARGWGPLPER